MEEDGFLDKKLRKLRRAAASSIFEKAEIEYRKENLALNSDGILLSTISTKLTIFSHLRCSTASGRSKKIFRGVAGPCLAVYIRFPAAENR